MDVTELHDEENLLIQLQDRWEPPRKMFRRNSSQSSRNYGITTIPFSSGNI
jgi:hypothetical protein